MSTLSLSWTPSAMPPGPDSTASMWAAAGTQMLTTSLARATSAALAPASAPSETAASTAAGSMSWTVTGPLRWRIRFSAMAEPIMPSPM